LKLKLISINIPASEREQETFESEIFMWTRKRARGEFIFMGLSRSIMEWDKRRFVVSFSQLERKFSYLKNNGQNQI
jgi:hypothetical protein